MYMRCDFIMDDFNELMSKWLNMVKGIVGSEDLPPVTSCETLQQNEILGGVKNNLAKKCLETLAEVAENKNDYTEFYE
eukprot:8542164-Heterocapsa_arctica.AAC.1